MSFEAMQAQFEGREAIYVEQGALRVRVSDISWDTAKLVVAAKIEEIPTPGLPAGVFCEAQSDESNSLRWSIAAGYPASFSKNTWDMGYGGWSIFFATELVKGIVALARQFPEGLHPLQKYREVLKYLDEHHAHEPTQRMFLSEG